MALKESRGGREYDKFVVDGSGDTATRVSVTSSITVTADTSAGAVTVAGATHTDSASGKTLIAATDVGGKERIGIQLWNTGAASGTNRDLIVQVWGSLKDTPGTLPGTGWTQIGDNIDLNAATSAYRAIATTPIKYIAVTAYLDNAGGGPLDTTADCYILAD